MSGRAPAPRLMLVAVGILVALMTLASLLLVWTMSGALRWIFLLQLVVISALALFHLQNWWRVRDGLPPFTVRTLARSPRRYSRSDVVMTVIVSVGLLSALALMALAVLGLMGF